MFTLASFDLLLNKSLVLHLFKHNMKFYFTINSAALLLSSGVIVIFEFLSFLTSCLVIRSLLKYRSAVKPYEFYLKYLNDVFLKNVIYLREDPIILYRIFQNLFNADLSSLVMVNTDTILRGHRFKLYREIFYLTCR